MAVKFRDYYEVLGVPRTATPDEIKRAYRKMARKHHPDLQPPAERPAAAERFKEINEANEVLSDPEKRSRYDALGANWKSGMDFTPPPGGSGDGGGGQWVEFDDLGQFSEFFESIFGRRGRGGRVQFRGRNAEAELPVTIEELQRGGRRRIGLGGDRSLEVEIPRGARDETVLRLAGQGSPGQGGGAAGDLYLHLRLVPHPIYRVSGEDDLEMDLPLWPWQAVLGTEVRMETPEGAVKLRIPPDTPSGRRFRLRERGLPRANGTPGDLYAVVHIEVPERPSAAERDAYEGLKRAATAPADRPAEG